VLDTPRPESIREAEESLLVDAFEKVGDLVVPVKQIHGSLPFFFPREEFLMEKTRTDVNPNHEVCHEKGTDNQWRKNPPQGDEARLTRFLA
jgi:hypothetical protein